MLIFFSFTDTATTEIYTLSLHDALPIFAAGPRCDVDRDVEGILGTELESSLDDPALFLIGGQLFQAAALMIAEDLHRLRSEEHTSELQSQSNLVCRLLLEKKKKNKKKSN